MKQNHRALHHPGRWLWLLLLVPIAIGLARLRFDVDIFDLLPSDLSVVQGLKMYQEHFSNARELVITIECSDPARSEAAAHAIADKLRPQSKLVSNVTWEPPWLEHPDQAAELLAYIWYNQPPQLFGDLTNKLAPDKLNETLQAARDQLTTSLSPQDIGRLSYDPFGLTQLPEGAAGAAPSFGEGQQSFSSPDGTFRILFVTASSNLYSFRDCEKWLNDIKPNVALAVAPLAETNSPLTINYTGRPAFQVEVAGGMQHDMIGSVGGTAAIIAILFWIAHRRIKPMLWLLTLLALILGGTLALGGLIYGAINIISLGFAAILLGLAVDYAVVHYQEALAHPGLTVPQIRHAIAPSIFWAAVTTISAFLVLNFSGLPGLDQLGTLVGLGVALSALVMIFEYLPPLFPDRNKPSNESAEEIMSAAAAPQPPPRQRKILVYSLSVVLLLFALVVLAVMGLPHVDSSANSLRPRGSPAYQAADAIQSKLGQRREPLWLVVQGRSEQHVAERLDAIQKVLGNAQSNHVISSFILPNALWPHPQFQGANRAAAERLISERNQLHTAAKENGFADTSLVLADRMLNTWQSAAATTGIFLPTNQLSQWVLAKVIALTPTNDYALGLIYPDPQGFAKGGTALEKELEAVNTNMVQSGEHVWLSGWEMLGEAIFSRVKANLWKVITPMIVLVFLSLWFAFRRPREILLSLTVLAISGLGLLAIMQLAHWKWNLMNLMAIPLILGTGVDYSIFMQLALRRYQGDLKIAHQAVGRALLLCGGTAIAAFASLAWSSNAGMASLGEVCAVGIAGNVFLAVFLLPIWWNTAAGDGAREKK